MISKESRDARYQQHVKIYRKLPVLLPTQHTNQGVCDDFLFQNLTNLFSVLHNLPLHLLEPCECTYI